MSELLARYNDIQQAIAALQAEADEIENALCKQVEETGTIAGYGWIATMKPGRKATDHEAAAVGQIVPDLFEALWEKHTVATVKTPLTTHSLESLIEIFGDDLVGTSTAWAKITKDGKCNLERHTTQAPPVFVVERVK